MFPTGFAGVATGVVAGRAGVGLGAVFEFVAGLFAAVFAGGCFVEVGAAATGVVAAVGGDVALVFTLESTGATGGTSVEIAPLVQI